MIIAQIVANGDSWLAGVLWGGVRQTSLQLFCLVLPFLLIGLMLHGLERLIQSPLAKRFGWRSVLWTGWLGTPVHELSHAGMCWLFAHRVDEIALFKPDERAGRLGYVRHSYNRRNPYQVVGNFFIGVAPLIGGTLVLYGLLWLFYPAAARQSFSGDGISDALTAGNLIRSGQSFLQLAGDVFFRIVTLKHLVTWQFWLFLYLALCVGSHLAPSLTDYYGAVWGGIVLLVFLYAFNLISLLVGAEPGWLVRAAAPVFGPALALFALCVALCAAATLAVLLFTKLIDLVFGVRR